ncbi:beta-galactosidase [Paraglaciecola chathamensis]|uniref:beta-galactosidase n=1 Tax=Paraglaciecola chathamensis TaxID=368405 RepID=UPI0026F7D293|nr:beta-galactosidase [Paraglaciecola chathamensis]MDO6842036.1 beta-galactosidase [Paraglaciecola chathamensis]
MNTSLYANGFSSAKGLFNANGFISAKGFMLSAITLAFTTVTGCDQQAADNTAAPANTATQKLTAVTALPWDFSDTKVLKSLTLTAADTRVIDENGEQKLAIALHSKDHKSAGFSFTPSKPWDWSQEGQFAFALDIENPDANSVHLYVSAKDAAGQSHNRSFVVPANSSDTYFMALSDPDLSIETGIRSNPNNWQSDYTAMIWRYGSKNIDVSQVKSIEFDVRGVAQDKHLIVDNLRLIKPQKLDDQYLVGLVDEFGQNDKRQFNNKIETVEQLRALDAKEQATFSHTVPDGRSKFNGWADGPKLAATGYFHTQKYQGKWTLVDPQGYLFFSNGIANVRMSNTSTITGYDFDQQFIEQRAAGDFTPEDSIGLNRAPEAAWPSRYVSSELRANMFTWLPSYDEPLGKHFGYRREVHTGAVEKGETYSFYRANLARKYASDEPNVFMSKWRDTTVDRMLDWGFTSFGNWIDPSFYQLNRIPYFANGWIIGDFKTVSSGNDYWSPLPDPFDPVFKNRAMVTAKKIAQEVQDNPWCVGVFIDNEKSWGQEGSIEGKYGIVIHTLNVDAKESPTKAQFVAYLKSHYSDIQQLNEKWNTEIRSWDALAKGVSIDKFNDPLIADLSAMLSLYAEKYFEVVHDAVAQTLPNHMYMGARFADWGMTDEIRKAAAKYADVMSYNYYKEAITDQAWDFLAEIDKPSIIGEFHNGALDSGLLNPGLIHAESQADRGRKYQEYVNSVIDNPYLIGAHWFQYIDSPLTGRAYDGENYNVGFVSVTDTPYQPLVDAAKEVNQQIYTRRFGNAQSQ